MSTQSWERLEAVVKWSELTIHNFAMKIGMTRSMNLYRIIRNKEDIHPKLAMLVCDNFPEINFKEPSTNNSSNFTDNFWLFFRIFSCQ